MSAPRRPDLRSPAPGRRTVDQTVRESEDKFARAFRSAPLLMAITDMEDATLVDFNDVALRVSGFSLDEVVGRTSVEIGWVSQSERDRLVAVVREQGRALGFEMEFHAKDGRRIVGLVGADAILIGDRPCLLTTCVDITARKDADETLRQSLLELQAAELALRQSEERFRTLTAAAFEGVAISENGVLLDVSDQMLATLWFERDEMVGRPVSEFVAPESQALVAARQRSGDEGAYEHVMLRKDGSRVVTEARGRSIRIGDRQLRLTALRDITERKREEERRLELERRLSHTHRLEALGTLAGGVAHDFNNILAAIFGNLAVMRTELPPGHPAQARLAEVERLSERARDLVRRILAFSRPQQGQHAPVRLHGLAEEAARMLRATIPAGVRFDVELAPDAPGTFGDETQLHQVVINLCTNAWQSLGGGEGRVTLRLFRRDVSAAEAAAGPYRCDGEFAVLSVEDTGCGMDAETASRAFDPFFTTKDPGEGTGLGLAVVHGIVTAHGGFVLVTSEPGRGSRFDVYVPAASVPSAPETAAITAAPAAATGARILFVDDEEALATVCALMLRREGFTVSTFLAPAAALAAFERAPDQFDLVITDLSMPGMNGVDLARAILERRADIPVILSTGRTTPALEAGIRALPISAVIDKPVSAQDLVATVNRVLRTSARPRG